MIKILFVCHGNICRSVMAQYILAEMARRRGVLERFEIDSAAVSREEIGNPIYPPAARELNRRGIPIGTHRARQITSADYDRFDRIYYMDWENYRRLIRLFPECGQKVQPLLPREVADPWYTGDFGRTFDDLEEGCRRILEEFA